MEYLVKSAAAESQRTGCLVLGVFEKRRLTDTAKQIDGVAGGQLTAILGSGDMDGAAGQTLLLHGLPGVTAERILLIGLGKEKSLNERAFRQAVQSMFGALSGCGARDVWCALADAPPRGRDCDWAIRDAVQQCESLLYRFDTCKSKKGKPLPNARKITFGVASADAVAAARDACKAGLAIGHGVNAARELGDLPANICTPVYLADQAKKLGKRFKSVSVEALDEKAMEKLSMGSLLAVGRGSREESRLIVMQYKGAGKSDPTHVLVGKGITFDTGGISIKPGAGMDEMKFDMCGAASVFGAMQAVAELELPVNLVGIVPAAENMPDGLAIKPGDIVTSMSGQTIEILNTDAEGRLVLCDALTYAERFKPASVVDVATLTGACVMALGHHKHGLMGNNTAVVNKLLAAGRTAADEAWQLPLGEEYDEQLKSNFADMANIGGRPAGSITAAQFLARFTGKYKWAHLDIAGTAWKSGDQKGATGRPVPLLVQYLMDQVGS